MALALVLAARAAIGWAQEVVRPALLSVGQADAAPALLAHAVGLGPRWAAGARSGEVVALATRGLDALDGYFGRYLPQLVLAVIVPVVVVVALAMADGLAALTVVLTVPLIPLFMVLIGVATERRRRPALARAGTPRPPLPGRGDRPAHAQGVRPGACPGGRPRAGHRRLPPRDAGHAADRLPVGLRARAAQRPSRSRWWRWRWACASSVASSTCGPGSSSSCWPRRPTCRCASWASSSTPARRACRPRQPRSRSWRRGRSRPVGASRHPTCGRARCACRRSPSDRPEPGHRGALGDRSRRPSR